MTMTQYIVRALGKDTQVESSIEAVKLCKRLAQKLPHSEEVFVLPVGAGQNSEAAISMRGEGEQ